MWLLPQSELIFMSNEREQHQFWHASCLYFKMKTKYVIPTYLVVLFAVFFFLKEFSNNSSYSSGGWSICEHAAEQRWNCVNEGKLSYLSSCDLVCQWCWLLIVYRRQKFIFRIDLAGRCTAFEIQVLLSLTWGNVLVVCFFLTYCCISTVQCRVKCGLVSSAAWVKEMWRWSWKWNNVCQQENKNCRQNPLEYTVIGLCLRRRMVFCHCQLVGYHGCFLFYCNGKILRPLKQSVPFLIGFWFISINSAKVWCSWWTCCVFWRLFKAVWLQQRLQELFCSRRCGVISLLTCPRLREFMSSVRKQWRTCGFLCHWRPKSLHYLTTSMNLSFDLHSFSRVFS